MDGVAVSVRKWMDTWWALIKIKYWMRELRDEGSSECDEVYGVAASVSECMGSQGVYGVAASVRECMGSQRV